MKKAIDDIVRDVRIALDEIGINDSGFIGSDQDALNGDEADLDTIIKSKIVEALRFCILSADVKLVSEEGKVMSLTPTSAGKYGVDLSVKYNEQSETNTVVAVMPEKFLRLLYAYVKGWSRAVTEVVDISDPQYAELLNPVATGTMQRPIAGLRRYYEAEAASDLGRYVLELFSVRNTDTIASIKGNISILLEPNVVEEEEQSAVPVSDVVYTITNATIHFS